METPYRTALLKLAQLLQDTGYRLEKNQRFNIHLTNALEPQEQYGQFPFMVILGNPPYNVSTANRKPGKDLTAKYKEGLKHETNLQPLSDDYIKFIALGQHLIKTNKTGGGILAYISNNSFLDGVIHWKMRKSLLETFDKIYVLNLHGNSRKKETDPAGGQDENVFNIKQGTSINIFVCHPSHSQEGNDNSPPVEGQGWLFYADLYGKRSEKYTFLKTQTLETSNFTTFTPHVPDYFFVPKDFSLKAEYDKGFGVNQLFIKQGTGIKFRKDNLLVKQHFTRQDVETMLRDMEQLEDRQILEKYKTTETKDWQLSDRRQYFLNYRTKDIVPVLYRVFDTRWTYYSMDKISKIIVRSDARRELMQHLFRENLVLLTLRNQPTVQEFDRVFIATGIIEHCVIGRGTYAFPLYYYDAGGKKQLNFNMEIVGEIAWRIGKSPAALDIFDYIYGVLHDSQYRKKYQEFLKMDFPRVPYPKDAAGFEQYVRVGSRLRKLHLLEDVPEIQTSFPVSGSNVVKDMRFADGKVFINDLQYFENVPVSVWNFFIGGSCPAQKYLKDRKGRVLSMEEILHYQKIAAVLRECV
jgi:predicted helicase